MLVLSIVKVGISIKLSLLNLNRPNIMHRSLFTS